MMRDMRSTCDRDRPIGFQQKHVAAVSKTTCIETLSSVLEHTNLYKLHPNFHGNARRVFGAPRSYPGKAIVLPYQVNSCWFWDGVLSLAVVAEASTSRSISFTMVDGGGHNRLEVDTEVRCGADRDAAG